MWDIRSGIDGLRSLARGAGSRGHNISFLCDPDDFGVIAEPFPAKAYLPEWFRKLRPVDDHELGANSNGQTVKRCMPFLDAMALGWILPLAASVRLQVADDGETVEYGSFFDRPMVSEHQPYQIAGHPAQPRPPLKLHNYWTICTPPGWSCLFTAPLNRAHPAIEILAGVVDTDRYASLINFPFIVTGADGLYTLEKGMPLVQVIPFRRDAAFGGGEIRSETDEEAAERERIRRATHASEGWYRIHARAARS
jgi:Family of unknown function (DUF6065)